MVTRTVAILCAQANLEVLMDAVLLVGTLAQVMSTS